MSYPFGKKQIRSSKVFRKDKEQDLGGQPNDENITKTRTTREDQPDGVSFSSNQSGDVRESRAVGFGKMSAVHGADRQHDKPPVVDGGCAIIDERELALRNGLHDTKPLLESRNIKVSSQLSREESTEAGSNCNNRQDSDSSEQSIPVLSRSNTRTENSSDSGQSRVTRWESVFYPHPRRTEIAAGLDRLPDFITALTPIRDKKRPYRPNWQYEEPISREEIKRGILDGHSNISKKGNKYTVYDSGFGLRTGNWDYIFCIDIDGESAYRILIAIALQLEIPLTEFETTSWTSGKKGKSQLAFRVPEQFRQSFEGFTRNVLTEYEGTKADEGDLLEFRYNRCQSVLPPSHHPDTGRYDYINGWKQLQELPIALCEFIKNWAEEDAKKVRAKLQREALKIEKKAKPDQPISLSTVSSDLLDIYRNEIEPRLDWENVYDWSGHEWKPHGLDHVAGYCPVHGGTSGTSFQVNTTDGTWHCKGCNTGGKFIEYKAFVASGNVHARGKDFVEIVENLAESVNVNLVDKYSPSEVRAEKVRADIEAKKIERELEKKLKEQFDKLNNFQRKPDLIVDCFPLDANLIEQMPKTGLVAINSPKGSAKSQTAKQLIEKLKEEDKAVLSIIPRILLGQEQCIKFEIMYWDNATDQAKQIVVTWDSLLKVIHSQQWDMIFIDEVRMGLEHLATAKTQVRYQRASTMHSFEILIKECLQNGGLVLVADADVTECELNQLERAGETKAFLIHNRNKGTKRTFKLATDSKDGALFSNEIVQQFKSNFDIYLEITERYKGNKIKIATELYNHPEFKPLAVTSDSQKQLEALEMLCLDACGDNAELAKSLLLRVDKKTTQEPQTQLFIQALKDHKTAGEWTIDKTPLAFFWSPSIGVGVSYTRSWFKQGYAFYYGVVMPNAFRQQIARPRPLTDWKLWISSTSMADFQYRTVDPKQILKDMFKSTKEGLTDIAKLAIDFVQKECQSEDDLSGTKAAQILANMFSGGQCDHAHLWYFAECEARKFYALSHHKEVILEELEEREGADIIPYRDEDREDSNKAVKEAKEIIKLEEATEMNTGVKTLALEEAQYIKNNQKAKYTDVLKAEGRLTADKYPGINYSPEWFLGCMVDHRQFLGREHFRFLVKNPKLAKELDARHVKNKLKEWEHSLIFLGDVKLTYKRVEFILDCGILKLLKKQKGTNQNAPYGAKDERVLAVYEYLKKHKDKLRRYFNLSIDKYPARMIARLLEKIGLTQKQVGQRKSGERIYKIKSISIDQLAAQTSLKQKYADYLDSYFVGPVFGCKRPLSMREQLEEIRQANPVEFGRIMHGLAKEWEISPYLEKWSDDQIETLFRSVEHLEQTPEQTPEPISSPQQLSKSAVEIEQDQPTTKSSPPSPTSEIELDVQPQTEPEVFKPTPELEPQSHIQEDLAEVATPTSEQLAVGRHVEIRRPDGDWWGGYIVSAFEGSKVTLCRVVERLGQFATEAYEISKDLIRLATPPDWWRNHPQLAVYFS